MRDSFPLPLLEQVVRSVGRWSVFFKLDLTSYFWQVPLAPAAREKVAFTYPDGLKEWHRVPFGVRNGPPHCQRIITTMLQENDLLRDAGAFIDDVGSGGDDHATAAARLDAVLLGLERRQLKASAGKLFCGLPRMLFLGHTVSKGTLHPDEAKVAAIKRLVPP